MSEKSSYLMLEQDSDTRTLSPIEHLGFGRDADLILDGTNRALHRCAGEFFSRAGLWLLKNCGRSSAFVLTDLDSSSFARLSPGKTMCLPFAHTLIDFAAGLVNYRLAAYQTAFHQFDDKTDSMTESLLSESISSGAGEQTETVGALAFNDEQTQLLQALSAPRVAGPMTATDLPASRELAAALGWSLCKLNRKLDHLCIKLARAGVHGVVSNDTQRANQRRLVLANFAIEHGLSDR